MNSAAGLPGSAEHFEQALRDCAAEPIHQIGQVQPHAGLLVLQPAAGGTVLQASDNIARFLGRPPAEVLGQPLASMLDADAVAAIEALMSGRGLEVTPLQVYLSAGLSADNAP